MSPLHMQTLYASYPKDPLGMTGAEQLAAQVMSLPMHPYLDESVQDYIVDSVLLHMRDRA